MESIAAAESALRIGTFLIEAVILVYVGKLARDGLSLMRGYRVNEIITVRNNVAAAIDLCGYLAGLVIGLLGSVVVSTSGWLAQASDVAVSGLVVIVVMLVADWVADVAVFRHIDDRAEIFERRNIALAIGRAAAALATGFVIRGALGHADTPLAVGLAWTAVGQVAMVIMVLIYQWLTPYDDLAEIRGNNIAAALPIAGILIAVGITVEAAVYGLSTSWFHDLLAVATYLGASVGLVWLLRGLTDRFLLPGTCLVDEIQRDRNAGAGLIEGTSFVLGALVVSFFLS